MNLFKKPRQAPNMNEFMSVLKDLFKSNPKKKKH